MAYYRTVFLDRDGTINVKPPDGHYVTDPSELELIPGASEAIRKLNITGRKVVVVTNQRCVALGLTTLDAIRQVHLSLSQQLATFGATIDRYYFCPHNIGECSCRKPLPGLLRQAMADDNTISAAESILIGDSQTDILAASAVQMDAILLRSTPPALSATGCHTALSLLNAVDQYLLPPAEDTPMSSARSALPDVDVRPR